LVAKGIRCSEAISFVTNSLHSLTDLFEVAMSHRVVVQGVVGAGVVIVGVGFLSIYKWSSVFIYRALHLLVKHYIYIIMWHSILCI